MLGLRGLTEIAVVQAADFGKLHDYAFRGAFDGPEVGCVFVEREVGARLMVIVEVAGQDAAEVVRILPRAVRGGEDFRDTHALEAMAELLAEDSVAIAER